LLARKSLARLQKTSVARELELDGRWLEGCSLPLVEITSSSSQMRWEASRAWVHVELRSCATLERCLLEVLVRCLCG